ncbi:MAG: hypothetical protein HN509_15290 [Halobacteriovoraceae bacterium]|nr:hypothetical protein [Halobacteriovoraceae bacterium]MBT5092654.1 hypothetical protein [Halobacteriovoraceae bacterium]
MLFVTTKEDPGNYLYQVAVPSGGTVEFNLLNGKYLIEAVSKDGCFAKTQLKVEQNTKAKGFSINLEKENAP